MSSDLLVTVLSILLPSGVAVLLILFFVSLYRRSKAKTLMDSRDVKPTRNAEMYGKFGYWHWGLSLVATFIVGYGGARLLEYLIMSVQFIDPLWGLWFINISNCVVFVLSRYIWVKTSCKRYASSGFYRVYTLLFVCVLAFISVFMSFTEITNTINETYQSYHLAPPSNMAYYPYTVVLCSIISLAFSYKLIKQNDKE